MVIIPAPSFLTHQDSDKAYRLSYTFVALQLDTKMELLLDSGPFISCALLSFLCMSVFPRRTVVFLSAYITNMDDRLLLEIQFQDAIASLPFALLPCLISSKDARSC